MWYLDRKKNQAVMSCSEETVACGNLKGIWAGALWLLCGYVGKKLNLPSARPINIERLMVEYGRSEAGLVKNLTGEGLYEPIVVSEAEFLPWVVANWEKVLMTAEEFFDDLESRRTPEYLSAQVTCYALGDDEPLEEDLQTLCYLAGSPKRLPDDPDVEGDLFAVMCYRPSAPEQPCPEKSHPAEKPETDEPEKEK